MKEPLCLQYFDSEIFIRNEPTYSPCSADNVHAYDVEYFLSDKREIMNRHGVTLVNHDGTAKSCILLASGGGTTVHERSALICKDTLYVAVGSQLCALALPTLSLAWNAQVDFVTCFEVLFSSEHKCLISHGELEIARVELDGNVTWSQSGHDIFTGELFLEPDQVKITDWNDDLYVFTIDDGRLRVGPKR